MATTRTRPAGRPRRLLRSLRFPILVLVVDAVLLMVPVLSDARQVTATAAMAALSLLLVNVGGRFRPRLHLSVLDELPALVGRLLTAAAAVAVIIALRGERDAVATFLRNSAMVVVLVVMGRALTAQLIDRSRRRGSCLRRTVLVGGGALGAELVEVLDNHPGCGLAVVGFVDDDPDGAASDLVPWLGHVSELDAVVRDTGASAVLISDVEGSECTLLNVLRGPACLECDVFAVPRLYHLHARPGPVDRIGSVPVVRILPPNLAGPARAIRRAFDVAISGTVLAVLSPLIGACALALRIEGGPGVIYRQPRVGRDGKPFNCLKLRSLRPRTAGSPTVWSKADGERPGRVARMLRRTSFDELLQLWNVLRGDMTLVGPRPDRPEFVARFTAQYECYRLRQRVCAGLTGFAQVNGLRGDTSIHDRARYDNYYIENWSLWFDIKVCLQAFSQLLSARGS